MEDSSPTVGAQALALMEKEPEVTTVIDQQRAMQEDYLNELIVCVNEFRKQNNQDFFISVLTKSEKLMPNVFRNYFIPRLSCPTPNYDQAVYKFDKEKEDIEFLWSIPCKEACKYIKANSLDIPQEEHDLLYFVLAFADGTLDTMCKQFNKEIV